MLSHKFCKAAVLTTLTMIPLNMALSDSVENQAIKKAYVAKYLSELKPMTEIEKAETEHYYNVAPNSTVNRASVRLMDAKKYNLPPTPKSLYVLCRAFDDAPNKATLKTLSYAHKAIEKAVNAGVLTRETLINSCL